MSRKPINSTQVVAAKQRISHAVKAGGLLFLSATPPWGDNYGLEKGDVRAQMQQCLNNIEKILSEAGYRVTDIVKMTIIYTRMQDSDDINEVYNDFMRTHFPDKDYPARTSYQAAMARRDFLIEIECVAAA